MAEKNSYINVEETEISKEIPKPKICNPLPTRPRPYYLVNGQPVFDYKEALDSKEANKHNT